MLNREKRLHELDIKIIKRLTDAMRDNWENIIKHIPDMPLK